MSKGIVYCVYRDNHTQEFMTKNTDKKIKAVSKNEVSSLKLSSIERMHLLTNLIIDHIIHDQNNGGQLLAKIRRENS